MTFTNVKFAIFFWTDGRIWIEGNIPNIYTGSHTPMIKYLMAHNLVEEKRKEALNNNKIGPKVLVAGSNFSGKSTLCHILLNYGIKLGWTPLYVDLDLSNEISVPGAIAAGVVDYIIPNDYTIDNSISLFHGSLNNDMNVYLYEKQINELASLVNNKLNAELDVFRKKLNLNNNDKNIFVHPENPSVFASGAIINSPTINKDSIYKNIIQDFACDYVFVLENERLYNDLVKHFKNNNKINICLLPKSGGVINLDASYKESLEQKKFTSYFKGPFNNLRLNEFSLDLNVYKLIQIIYSNVTSALLPIGSTTDLNLILREVNLEEENLLNRVIAIQHIEDKVLEDLDKDFDRKLNSYMEYFSRAPVSYFAYIIKYEKNSKTLRIHTSCSEIKHKHLMLGNIKYSNI
jgi:polyribonucleotide 5'-hydroxyl-kinase